MLASQKPFVDAANYKILEIDAMQLKLRCYTGRNTVTGNFERAVSHFLIPKGRPSASFNSDHTDGCVSLTLLLS